MAADIVFVWTVGSFVAALVFTAVGVMLLYVVAMIMIGKMAERRRRRIAVDYDARAKEMILQGWVPRPAEDPLVVINKLDDRMYLSEWQMAAFLAVRSRFARGEGVQVHAPAIYQAGYYGQGLPGTITVEDLLELRDDDADDEG